jgi:hypothetical protein
MAGRLLRKTTAALVPTTLCPIDLRGLLGDVRYWMGNGTYAPDEIACVFITG